MGFNFEIKFPFVMYKILLGHLLWLEVGMVTLSGCHLIQTKGFLVLKSIFSLILCQVLQNGLLFLGFDMFFMVSRL